MENNGGESPSAGASTVKKASDFFPDKAHVTDTLRTTLANLDASDLTRVYEKHMLLSDRNKLRTVLLMSCKRVSFATLFTETEMPLAHHRPEPLKTQDEEHNSNDHDSKDKGKRKDGGKDDNNNGSRNNNGKHKMNDGSKDGMGEHKKKCGSKANNGEDECRSGKDDTGKDDQEGKDREKVLGLAVQAYDRDGRVYELNLKYLSSNTAYRIIGPDYKVFLKKNGFLVGDGGVTRKGSRRQKKRRNSSPDEEEEPNGQEPAVRDANDVQMELWAFRSPKLMLGEKDHPNGALGLLLLHHRGGEAGQVRVGGAAEEDQVQVVAPQEVVEQQPQRNGHGTATQGEDMRAHEVSAADCAGDAQVEVATIMAVADVDVKPGDASTRRDRPLCATEKLIVGWLSFLDANDDCTCKQRSKCTGSASKLDHDEEV